MGLNFVIACPKCERARWMLRGEEDSGIHRFYRSHMACLEGEPIPFTHDQTATFDAWESAGYIIEYWPPDDDLPDTMNGEIIKPRAWCGSSSARSASSG